jgi:hypothetical protein
MISKAVLTIATGKPVYIQMAVNLARSFKLWHKNSSIKFTIATDQKHLFPPDLSDIQFIELQPGQYGKGFSPKWHLDKIAPADKTLFIDADCLCVGSLESVFDRFAGHAVSVVGRKFSEGEWFGDIAAVCQRFNVEALPKFNGGIYYLEKGEVSDRVYKTARELAPQYDEIGLRRLRNRPNDELLMAIAMAIHGQTCIPEDGSIMAEPLNFACGIKIDVFKGTAALWNLPGHPKYQETWPLTEAHPIVVHFLGAYTDSTPYISEALRLEKVIVQGWPVWAATFYVMVTCSFPQTFWNFTKDVLRPVYRKLFGVRPVLKSNKI